jgi:hypothetical protein
MGGNETLVLGKVRPMDSENNFFVDNKTHMDYLWTDSYFY